MATVLIVLKALAVMLLAAMGSGGLYGSMHSIYGADGVGVGFSVFQLLGAFFLYRAWFAKSG